MVFMHLSGDVPSFEATATSGVRTFIHFSGDVIGAGDAVRFWQDADCRGAASGDRSAHGDQLDATLATSVQLEGGVDYGPSGVYTLCLAKRRADGNLFDHAFVHLPHVRPSPFEPSPHPAERLSGLPIEHEKLKMRSSHVQPRARR